MRVEDDALLIDLGVSDTKREKEPECGTVRHFGTPSSREARTLPDAPFERNDSDSHLRPTGSASAAPTIALCAARV